MNRARGWAIALAALGVLGTQACTTTCGQYEAALNNCGGSFNSQKCNQNIGQCSSADVRTISDAANCLENDAVCKNGSIVNGVSYGACILPVASVSQPCQAAVF